MAMAIAKCLATATAALVLSISVAGACDDFEDEMTIAEAMKAAKLARSQLAPAGPAAAPSTAQGEPTSVAAVEPGPTQETPTATVRQ